MSPNSVAVLMTNPLDFAKRESFSQATDSAYRGGQRRLRLAVRDPPQEILQGRQVRRRPASDDVDITSVTDIISSAYDGGPGREVKAEDLESEDSAPIIQLTNRIIEDAYVSGASDIHIEPQEKSSSSATASTVSARKSFACPSR
jgi:type II secretory ATPase GspE/PulE/Tfp pilus assembly ATPase PilB-like protein